MNSFEEEFDERMNDILDVFINQKITVKTRPKPAQFSCPFLVSLLPCNPFPDIKSEFCKPLMVLRNSLRESLVCSFCARGDLPFYVEFGPRPEQKKAADQDFIKITIKKLINVAKRLT